MNHLEKIAQLRSVIETNLSPIIRGKYVLWGFPYHKNIGDTLIWQGELDFLKTLPVKNVGVAPWSCYPGTKNARRKSRLSQDTMILITGGGFWGDVWREGWEDVMEGIMQYPNNPILFFPQTIFYKDESFLELDKKNLSRLSNVTICTRDTNSYQLALEYFGSFAKILLVPDMAFYISLKLLNKWVKPTTDKTLYLRRLDKEAINRTQKLNENNVDVRDWPTMEPGFKKFSFKFHKIAIGFRYKLERECNCFSAITTPIADYYMKNFFRLDIIKIGVQFVSQYKLIRTTRLHVLILSVLLGKPIICEDNSYGKLSSFYNTWLSDLVNSSIEKN